MIELSVKSSQCNTKFHFHTMSDCKKFLYVFENHMCNVPWKKPVIVSGTKLSEYEKTAINEDPTLRAERNLSWGFNLARQLDTDTPNEQQKKFVNKLVALFTK